jgi:hypothetical protein
MENVKRRQERDKMGRPREEGRLKYNLVICTQAPIRLVIGVSTRITYHHLRVSLPSALP